jgi:hypothetical protein
VGYKCCNYQQCGEEFETKEERANHEYSCEYVPPPPPPSGDDEEKAS